MYRKTADEIMALDPELAIIPVGSLEQHGHHLPVMTDWAIASELGRRVAAELGAFLVPALPISTCRENMGKKGTVWMEPVTYYQMMTDWAIASELGRRVAAELGAFLVPALPISTCRENMGKKGTVWMEPVTYY